MGDEPLIEEKLDRFRNEPLFIAETILLEITEQIAALMKKEGLRNKDLAERLGVSRSYISRLMDGGSNLTVKSLAAISVALDARLTIRMNPTVERILQEKFSTPQHMAFAVERQNERTENASAAQVEAEAAASSGAVAA